MGRFEPDDNEYHGDDEVCGLGCGATRIEHNGVLFCVIHDNPDVGEGTWFTAWGESFPGDGEGAATDSGDTEA